MNNFESAISTPIISSATFAYKNSQEAQDIFSGLEDPENISEDFLEAYRLSNQTI